MIRLMVEKEIVVVEPNEQDPQADSTTKDDLVGAPQLNREQSLLVDRYFADLVSQNTQQVIAIDIELLRLSRSELTAIKYYLNFWQQAGHFVWLFLGITHTPFMTGLEKQRAQLIDKRRQIVEIRDDLEGSEEDRAKEFLLLRLNELAIKFAESHATDIHQMMYAKPLLDLLGVIDIDESNSIKNHFKEIAWRQGYYLSWDPMMIDFRNPNNINSAQLPRVSSE